MLFYAGEQESAKECAEINFSQFYKVTAAPELVFKIPFTATGKKCALAECCSSEVF